MQERRWSIATLGIGGETWGPVSQPSKSTRNRNLYCSYLSAVEKLQNYEWASGEEGSKFRTGVGRQLLATASHFGHASVFALRSCWTLITLLAQLGAVIIQVNTQSITFLDSFVTQLRPRWKFCLARNSKTCRG
jgi:hypothetical protein